MFNTRETRDALTPFERNFLNETFGYLGAGLGIVAASSYGLHRSGFSYRIMRANPWVVMGISLVASIGSMIAVFNTPPEKTGQKLFWWTAFNVAQSATLAPLFFFSPALLARAGLYTAGMVGSLCYVGATARSDKYLYIGGMLERIQQDVHVPQLTLTIIRPPLCRSMRRRSELCRTSHPAGRNSSSSSHAGRLIVRWLGRLWWIRSIRYSKDTGAFETGRARFDACRHSCGIVSF